MRTKLLAFSILILLLLFVPIGNRLSAQNTGPIAPEAVAFEPVDATDMVNLLTGDFSYVLPIVDIPGPGGGYQMALSYHGGIAMDQEASWVGLGWSLSPGAINRSVDGVPDDWSSGQIRIRTKLKDQTFESWTIAAGVGFANGAGSVGVSYSWGSHKSFGGTVGFGPYSVNANSSGGFGASMSTQERGVGFSIGVSNNGVSFDASYNHGVGKGFTRAYSGTGISFSSSGSVGFSAVGGAVNFGSDPAIKASGYSTSSSGFYIPVYLKCFYFGFGHRKTTYSYKDIEYRFAKGTLHWGWSHPTEYPDQYKYVFDVLESGKSNFSNDLSKQDLFISSSVDNYSVASQGLQGKLNLSSYELGVILGNNRDYFTSTNGKASRQIKQSYLSSYGNLDLKATKKPFFHFQGSYDASSRVKLTKNPLESEIVFSNNSDLELNRRGGANVVEYFTFDEINSESRSELFKRGFIETESMIGGRQIRYGESHGSIIGAYAIIAQDGKTYHYSQPVFQYEEILRRNTDGGENCVEKLKGDRYAHSWLLTAITGSDYIDANNDYMIDDGDLGYWVKFNYGKWTDCFIWQFPYELDATYQTYDKEEIYWGRKQIYYLNSAETKTHKALFLKGLRKDGLSASKEATVSYNKYTCKERLKPLALKKIVLIKKDESTNIDCTANNLVNTIDDNYFSNVRGLIHNDKGYYWPSYSLSSILDVGDVSSDFIKEHAIKVVDFHHDYDLCGNTPSSKAPGKGKLTLNSLMVKGQGGEAYQPPYFFDYNKGGSYYITGKDIWGYSESQTDSWSLGQITTPLGAKIKVDYEEDTYSREFLRKDILKYNFEEVSFKYETESVAYGIDKFLIQAIKLKFSDNIKLDKIFNVGQSYVVRAKFFNYSDNQLVDYRPKSEFDSKSLKLIAINDGTLSFEYIDNFRMANDPLYPTSGLDIDLKPIKVGVEGVTYDWMFENFHVTAPNIYFSGKGGGVRVKKIDVIDENLNTLSTQYSYNFPNSDISSGITSIAPVDMDNIVSDKVVFQEQLPPPCVIYKNVKVSQKDGSYMCYEFQVYDNETVQVKNAISSNFVGISDYEKSTKIDEIKVLRDNISSVGRLISKYTYNDKNDLGTSEQYIYKDIDNIDYGLNQELFLSSFTNSASEGTVFKRAHSKINYPSVLDRVINTEGNLKSETINLEWDKNTGVVLKTKTITPTNEILISESVPAYTKYPGMGSKIQNPDNENMLSQQTASYQYKVFGTVEKLIGAGIQTWEDNWTYRKQNADGSYGDQLINGIWRKHKSFSWRGNLDTDGTYSGFTDYTWGGSDSSNESKGWQKTSEVTRYSTFSAPLEQKDINGNFGATRYDASGLNVIASIGNARWGEFTASGFEDIKAVGNYWSYEGELQILKTGVVPMISSSIPSTERDGVSAVTGIDAHTGKHYLKLTGKKELLNYLTSYPKGKKMRLSAWIHKNSASSTSFYVNGLSEDPSLGDHKVNSQKTNFGNWVLMTADFTFPLPSAGTNRPIYYSNLEIGITTASSSNVVYLDDFRIHPIDAPMSAYVYDTKTDALTAILDGENIATKYEYDAGGRLMKVEKETPSGFKLVSEHDYHYAKEIVDEAPRISNFTVSPILDNRSGFFYRVNLNYQLSGGKATEYCLSLDNNFTGNNYWYSYQSNVATSIPLGSHTVYFKVRNILGQESNVVSASAVNAFSLNLDKSNIYYRDPIKGTVYFPNNSYLDGGDLSYKIYQNNNLIKTVSPSFTSAGSNTKLMPIDESDGNITTSAQHFEFSSYGLSKGDYQLIVSGGINNEDSRVSDFSIVSPPPPPPTPSCWASYDEYNSRVTVNWSNFPCSAVNIYLNGVKQAYASVSGGSGTSTFRATLSDLNNGDDPRLMRESELEGERLIEEPGGPSLSNTVKVMCTSGSGQASCPVLMDLLPQ